MLSLTVVQRRRPIRPRQPFIDSIILWIRERVVQKLWSPCAVVHRIIGVFGIGGAGDFCV